MTLLFSSLVNRNRLDIDTTAMIKERLSIMRHRNALKFSAFLVMHVNAMHSSSVMLREQACECFSLLTVSN